MDWKGSFTRLIIFTVIIPAVTLIYFSGSCSHHDSVSDQLLQSTPISSNQVIKKINPKSRIVVDVFPFGTFSGSMTTNIVYQLKMIFPEVIPHKNLAFPANAYYNPRNRYKADSLIDYLKTLVPAGHIAIGLSDKDISTKSGNYDDWGIFGLSEMPGKACVASTFRLNSANLSGQFFKLVIHELGHSVGLDHCDVDTCLMRDANGKNTFATETDFCIKCRNTLIQRGWF